VRDGRREQTRLAPDMAFIARGVPPVPEQVDHVRLLHARPDNNDDQSDVSQQLVRGRVWLYRVGATTGVVRVPCVRY
jgi:exopolysaccharide biosynthesis predicted pyruvyltransferase EpsI